MITEWIELHWIYKKVTIQFGISLIRTNIVHFHGLQQSVYTFQFVYGKHDKMKL